MFLFDDLIREVDILNNKYNQSILNVDLNKKFIENENQIIFNDDKAFELGANPYYGINLDLLTDNIEKDEIILYGNDINSIKENQNYARITISSIDNEKIGKGNLLYSNIRKYEYIKYHFAIDGVMVRESAINRKESLLFSKKSLRKNKIDFSLLGSYFISKYKTLNFIKNVKIIFITIPEYDYETLSTITHKSEDITKALDHLMNKVKMDCHSCSLQVICNEVEKKVKEDFAK